MLERVRQEIGDLYPLIPDPKTRGSRETGASAKSRTEQKTLLRADDEDESTPFEVPPGYLMPVAYLWTRTVRCKNPSCKARVPLYAQTWLRKKKSGYVALRPVVRDDKTGIRFELVTGASISDMGFDPSHGITGTATVCACCGGTQDADYIRREGESGRYGQQLMAVICVKPGQRGKIYTADPLLVQEIERLDQVALERVKALEELFPVNSLDQTIPPSGNAGYATGKSYLHGIQRFRQAYTPKQLATLLCFAKYAREATKRCQTIGASTDQITAIATCLALIVGRCTDRGCSLVRWNNIGEKIESFSSFKRYAMMWDYPEVNLLGSGSGNAASNIEWTAQAIEACAEVSLSAVVRRGDATDLSWAKETFDAVITDPPYYDNESYAELSDMFYIWNRFILHDVHPEHTASELTPKKKMIVAAAYLHGGAKESGKAFYETALAQSLHAANDRLKFGGSLVLVYAHKTTVGWATLVDAVRRAGFSIDEAWPLATEKQGRAAHQDDAALASSIFLVGRKRPLHTEVGNYEDGVQPDLEKIVRERVETLWDMGISGADLVIACVGAGLRAFTKYEKVEYSNGEEVPAEKFLAEVEGVVLDTMMGKLFGQSNATVSAIDPAAASTYSGGLSTKRWKSRRARP